MYLLDTNALLILLFGYVTERRLSENTMKVLVESDRIYLSIVSLWEMAIKIKLGKLKISSSMVEIAGKCVEMGIEVIPLKTSYLDKTLSLPLLPDHKDPFDRLIMATALIEDMTIVSTDEKMQRGEYCVNIIS